MSVGQAEAAAAKFMAVAKINPTGHQACLAAVNAALALLATGRAEALSEAADVLQHHQLFGSLDASLSYAERCADTGHMARCTEQQCINMPVLLCYCCILLVICCCGPGCASVVLEQQN